MEMTAIPNTIIELTPTYCRGCGVSLKEKSAIKGKSRQIVDIPPIKSIYRGLEDFMKFVIMDARYCGFSKGGKWPGESWKKYWGTYWQLSPLSVFVLSRLNETLKDAFDIPISRARVHCLLCSFSKIAPPINQMIK